MFSQTTKYGILGLARSGVAAAYKIKEMGGKAFLSDAQAKALVADSAQLEQDFECEFGGHSSRLYECDEWIVSPGIPLNVSIITEGILRGIPMMSEIEFGYRIKAPDSKIIAVTGTNGKSTTTSLIYHILKEMGYKTILAGNIGDAFCGYPINIPGIEYIVLEISSFQLDLINHFRPDVGVLLNITPDHLDRYQSFEHYASSKFRLFANQRPEDIAVICYDDPQIRMREDRISSTKKYFSSHPSDKVDSFKDDIFIHFTDGAKKSIHELGIRGQHNYLNTMAAVLAASALVKDTAAALAATIGFKPLRHRMEFVQTINGVSFYNDSKATNMNSVQYALLTFERPIRIIMGGSDKGEDYSVLSSLLAEKALKIYITGATADKMRQAWLGKIPLVVLDDLETCVLKAFEESLPGDNVVLSPGCASFDRFKNFEHRGDSFIEIVGMISEEIEKNMRQSY